MFRERGEDVCNDMGYRVTCELSVLARYVDERMTGLKGKETGERTYMITLNAHMLPLAAASWQIHPAKTHPPKAKANWKNETAAEPAGPKQWCMTPKYESLPLSLALTTTSRMVLDIRRCSCVHSTNSPVCQYCQPYQQAYACHKSSLRYRVRQAASQRRSSYLVHRDNAVDAYPTIPAPMIELAIYT